MATESTNSCCALWKDKYSKVLASRNALREAVKILQQQIDVKESENVNLKKACEDERNRAQMEEKEKRKSSSALLTLENEVTRLKSEINLLQQTSRVEGEDRDKKVFQDKISKHKKETGRLKELLDIEKRKADERDEEWKCKLTLLEKEANEAKSKFVSETHKLQETIRKLEAAKQKLIKEKKDAESEIKKLQEQRKVVESYKKKTDMFSQKLLENSKSLEEANRQLEIEKQKVIREMRRADEEKKLAEENWKKAMEERHNAEQLSQQLHKNRLMLEDLKKINELSSSRRLFHGSENPMNKDDEGESNKVKFLKKQLKFEKLRVKHAKEELKLEARRNGILKQELGHLKLDFSQYVHRLNMLDISFPSSCGIIDDLEKPDRNADVLRSNKKRDIFSLRADKIRSQLEEEILLACCSTVDVCDPKMKTRQLTPSNLNKSVGNSAYLFSGTESKLKPPIGGPYKKMMKSSAINSTTESFSDGQLMGSQERGALSVNASENLAENFIQGTTISDRSGEVTKLRCDDSPPFSDYTCRSPLTLKDDKIVDKNDRKRKRACDAVEYIEGLCSEHKKLNLMIEKQFANLSCFLERKTGNCSIGEACAVKSHKNRKRTHKPKADKENQCDKENITVSKDEARVIEDKNVCSDRFQPYLIESGSPLRGKPGLHGSTSNLEPIFDSIVSADGNYMKLLDLDDDADEELYRTARDKLLSPLLHTIKSNVNNIARKPQSSSEETLHVQLFSDRGNLLTERSCSGIDGECDLKIPKFNTPNASDDLLQYNMQSYEDDGKNGKIFNSQVQNSTMAMSSNGLNSANEGVTPPLHSKIENLQDSLFRCHVTFPAIQDCNDIYRIFAATRNCIARCKLDCQAVWMASTILSALAIEENLSSKERVCVLLSLLLLNFSIVSESNLGELSNGNAVSRADSYAGHISSEAGTLFQEYDILDELLCIMEEFLICGKVMTINYAILTNWDLSPNGACIPLSSEIASSEQLVACSIILSSICTAIHRSEFIFEVSYNVFRLSGWDSSVLLTILHVCAHLGREKLFIFSNHSLIIAVMRSVIMFLDSGRSSEASICPEVNCPFSDKAASVDITVSILLENIGSYAFPTNRPLKPNVLLDDEKTEGTCLEEVDCVMASDMPCCLKNCMVLTTTSNIYRNNSMCHLADLLSLVELLAYKMRWEWTSSIVIPELLKILESCVVDCVAIAVVSLLGQLGRLGVETSGFDCKEVVKLRCGLLAYLCGHKTANANSPLRVAVLIALLGLTPVDPESLLKGSLELPPSLSSDAEIMRSYFSQLSKDEHEFCYALLKTDTVIGR